MKKTEINIGLRKIGPHEPCLIIAEAGVNHNGELSLALEMVDAAAAAGADVIKFQTFRASKVASAWAPKAGYQLRTTDPGESQQKMLKGLELDDSHYEQILAHCQQKKIMFLSTPYDTDSLAYLVGIGMEAVKISSTDLTNPLLLEAAAKTSLPVICSTGMADLQEVRQAVSILENSGCSELALLHCVSGYPADAKSVNLRAMNTMAREFSILTGYSDHTSGIEIPMAAVALGACIIEKHFTLDRSMPGPDHEASCEPEELWALVSGIRKIQSALGDGNKQPTAIEMENRKMVRRSLAAARALPAGTVITKDTITALRPGTGIAPTRLHDVIGRTLTAPMGAGEFIQLERLR